MNDALWCWFDELRPGPETGICPLCGMANAHLTPCPGCGREAWSRSFQAEHGEEAAATLRTTLRAALGVLGAAGEEAVMWAYQPGGCRLCPACRGQAQRLGAYWCCPLFLLGERTLDGMGSVPTAYLPALWRGENWLAWSKALQSQWCDGLESGSARWRRAILDAALARSADQEAIP